TLFERHFDTIARFVKNKVSHQGELEDLVQQVFLRCVEGRDRFEGRSSFRTYLFAVAHNTLLEHFRRRRRTGGRVDTSVTSVADLDPSPSMIVALRQEQQQVVDALRRLPLDYQIALELHYWERLSGSEMAEVLDVPEGTVRNRLRQGKQLLAKKIRQQALTGVDEDLGDLEEWIASIRETVQTRSDDD
ncbi:MAG: sigma-70 family RNA polymerase sigma factor, partial [Deltaproteobacteria bacterium]|nr:sigma-70 family RNA polymerase sigma factor [Deltaproteobacteria bacterium]